MLDLTATQAALAAGLHVNLPILFQFDFASGTKRYWLGPTDVELGGLTWTGRPIAVSVEFGTLSVNGTAENFRIGLSGLESGILAALEAERAEWIGRTCSLWFHFFSDNWQPLDSLVKLRTGVMLGMSYDTNPAQRTATLDCESKWIAQGYPPLAYLSLVEQQRRFPGDLGLNRITELQNKTIQWPTF